MKQSFTIRTSHSSRGFTLIELIIIIALIGVMSSIARVWYQGYIEQARVSHAVAQIASLNFIINDYILENGIPPDSLESINNARLLDPWGNPYRYRKLDIENTASYSMGTNGYGGMGGFGGSSWSEGEANQDDNDEQDEESENNENDNNDQDSADQQSNNDSGGSNNSGSSNTGSANTGSSNNGSGDSDATNNDTANARIDQKLVSLNTDYDLYSMGKDGLTDPSISAPVSQDDIIRASNGAYVGLASGF